MSKLLTSEDINKLSQEFGLSIEKIKAVILVESSGCGFDLKTGLIKIQFEPVWFERFEKTKILNGVEGQSQEWAAYKQAAAINEVDAMKSTSWGNMQVMGFNHLAAGYADVKAMVKEFLISEYYQVRGGLRFIASNPAMFSALKDGRWADFAAIYNGPSYKKFNYDTRLSEAFNKLKK